MKIQIQLLALIAIPFFSQAAIAAVPFNDACYLARYPDVDQNWGGTAKSHYDQNGIKEGRNPGCDYKLPKPANSKYYVSPFPSGFLLKSSPAAGSQIELLNSPREYASAIISLKWNGVEFINIHDKGRQLQTAWSFDAHGECFNPTEAGSSQDKGASSSRLLEVSLAPAFMATLSQSAYWLRGSQTGGGCPAGPQVSFARGPYYLQKVIQMNYQGDPHAIEMKLSFQNNDGIPRHAATYEVLTGYLTTDFNRLFSVRANSATPVEEPSFAPLSGAGYGQNTLISNRPNKYDPIIVSNASGSHAMGALFPKQEVKGSFDGYQFWKFAGTGGPKGGGTTKWNIAVFERNSVELQTSRSFRVILVVGNLQTVAAKLKALAAAQGNQGPQN
ncbi:MAG: hypothetical protein V4736_12220 [Bdellovibrionota bacterium]